MNRKPYTLHRVAPNDWPAIIAQFDDASYQQCRAYAEALAARDGSTVELNTITDADGTLLGAACVRIRRLPLVGGGIAYIAGGPMVRLRGKSDADSTPVLERCLRTLRDDYTGRRGFILRVFPALGDQHWNQCAAERCTAMGFAESTQTAGYRTLILNLAQPLDAIHRGLNRKWRNHLRQAQRNELVIQSGTDTARFEIFRDLYDQLCQRKSFHAELDAAFYADVQAALGDDEKLLVSIALHDGEPVAGHVAAAHGERCVYLLGAANETGLKLKAAHLLQWYAIETAQQQGRRFYDLGGIDPEANPGVYDFKKGLGGDDMRAAGPYELRPPGLRAVLTHTAEQMYRKLHRAA